MALVLADRVKETSTTAGTGTLTLGGASTGFQSFAAVGNGNTTYYAISDAATGDWEVGIGTYSNGATGATQTAGPTAGSWATDGSLVGSNITWYSPSDTGYIAGDYVLLFDQTAGSSFFYYGQITLIQFAGGFGWAFSADVLSSDGTPNGDPSSSWNMQESTGITLSRTTVLSSSASGALVAFGSGSKDVFVTYPSEKGVWLDAAGKFVQTAFTNLSATGTATIGTATLTAGTVSTTPASNTDIANKQYVDGLVTQGISYHEPVYVESPNTAGNLTALYNQPGGAGNGVGATLTNNGTKAALTIDNVLMTTTKRVLVYNQTNAFENGVYSVTTVGTPDPGGTNWVLTRTTDADTYGLRDPDALGYNDAFFVTNGDTGAGETYVCTTSGTIVFGTTNITFAQISSSQVYNAGTGLNLSPATTFNIANTTVSANTYGSASAVPVFTVNAQGQLTGVTNTTIAITGSQVSGNITGQAGSVANALTAGTYLTSGGTFDGSVARTFTVDATSANTASKVVARDVSGNFSAGTITAALSGNATTATTATNVAGGAANQIVYNTAASTTGYVVDPTASGQVLGWNGSAFSWVTTIASATTATNVSGGTVSATTGTFSTSVTLNNGLADGASVIFKSSGFSDWEIDSSSGNLRFFQPGVVYGTWTTSGLTVTGTVTATTFAGTATRATNIAGGAANQIPYQTGVGTTGFIATGTTGQVLTATTGAAPSFQTSTAASKSYVQAMGILRGL